MVRTKADGATRVAAGGKAPKKSLNRTQNVPTENVTGKDNLPVNRYCPRETPAWQKKITQFYERNNEMNESNGFLEDKSMHNNNKKIENFSSEMETRTDLSQNTIQGLNDTNNDGDEFMETE